MTARFGELHLGVTNHRELVGILIFLCILVAVVTKHTMLKRTKQKLLILNGP